MAKKVLIVDDEPNIVLSLEFLMKRAGFDVAVARDGEEALAQVAAFAPDGASIAFGTHAGEVCLADGATGSNLFEVGLMSGDAPELWNTAQPEKIRALHQSFVRRLADIIQPA
jgi:DNA-binding NarL/FixJ family response regulator